MGVGVGVKTLLNIILLRIPSLNIYGGAMAVIACYFTITLINLIMIGFTQGKVHFCEKKFSLKKRALIE